MSDGMRIEHIGDAVLMLGDCMDVMREMPDKAFELAIVDPPYGIGINHNMGRRAGIRPSEYTPAVWDASIPPPAYFRELMRVSDNQIIWGGNYFPLPPTPCWVLWDKGFSPDVTFAQFEMAWTSFLSSAKKFDHTSADPINRIHPTQKVVALYKWLLSRYAKPGDKILDTHGGSGSSVVACLDMGYPITWIEKDEDYYNAALKRIEIAYQQPRLFDEPRILPQLQDLPL